MRSMVIAALLLGAMASLAACKNEIEDAVRSGLVDGRSAEFESVEQCAGDGKIYYGRVKTADHVGSASFFYDGGEVAFAGSPSFTRLMKWCHEDLTSAASADAAAPSLQHKAVHK
ncbi:hypothetical protein [Novosphingobium sp. BL-52-GroH]|uniref:hypothetical protein n=1 Tax=Novosphingobium sp. BL-52-GroH TaxID=3349877 RepID=UPI00384CAA17